MRARNIKQGFFKNEILGTSDPMLSILFAGLWCLADRDGKLEDRPLRIKAEIFPYRDQTDIHRLLTELSRLNFIRRYEVDGKGYILVIEFAKHQRPHHTEKKSVLPDIPTGYELTDGSPLKDGEYPPDLLIPDSLIPDSKPHAIGAAETSETPGLPDDRLKALHLEQFGGKINVGVLAQHKAWLRDKIPFDKIQQAYFETAVTKGQPTRWRWIVEIVRGDERQRPPAREAQAPQMSRGAQAQHVLDEMLREFDDGEMDGYGDHGRDQNALLPAPARQAGGRRNSENDGNVVDVDFEEIRAARCRAG